MLLYIIYIEPLLLALAKSVSGFSLEAPLRVGPKNIDFEGAREVLESFVDDIELVLTNDVEFTVVDNILSEFEVISGAIVNRSMKTKVMGLGGWSGRKTWPLKWLKSVDELEIFGIRMSPSFHTILDLNWEHQLGKFRSTLFSWSTRSLNTFYERASVLTTLGLYRLWYRASILPLPNTWANLFEAEIRRFLWRNQPLKNVLSLETACLPICQGGLGLPYLRAKCDALHLKQGLRIVSTSRVIRDHLGFWFGGWAFPF